MCLKLPVNKFLELIFIVQLLTTAVMLYSFGGGQNLMMGNMSKMVGLILTKNDVIANIILPKIYPLQIILEILFKFF